jgi:hypothetical protein
MPDGPRLLQRRRPGADAVRGADCAAQMAHADWRPAARSTGAALEGRPERSGGEGLEARREVREATVEVEQRRLAADFARAGTLRMVSGVTRRARPRGAAPSTGSGHASGQARSHASTPHIPVQSIREEGSTGIVSPQHRTPRTQPACHTQAGQTSPPRPRVSRSRDAAPRRSSPRGATASPASSSGSDGEGSGSGSSRANAAARRRPAWHTYDTDVTDFGPASLGDEGFVVGRCSECGRVVERSYWSFHLGACASMREQTVGRKCEGGRAESTAQKARV